MDLGDLLVQLPHLIDEEAEMGRSEGPDCPESDLQTDGVFPTASPMRRPSELSGILLPHP